MYIGLIIIISSLIGRDLLIQPYLFGIGYFVGFILILCLPFVNRKLAYGKSTKFQDNMDNVSILLNVVLCTASGLIIGFNDLRLFWLCIFIVVGIHFFGFYFSQGKIMLLLGFLTVLNGVIALFLNSVPFLIFAMIDGSLKLIVGLIMLNMKRTTHVPTYLHSKWLPK